MSRGVTLSGKIIVAGFAMSQVLWPQEAQWRLAREPADILDSPAMESIRKWFYRPKVISFCSSIYSLFLISSSFLFFKFDAFLRFFFVSVYFLSYWLVDRTRALVLFSSFLIPVSVCWTCALLPPVSWKFARYPEVLRATCYICVIYL